MLKKREKHTVTVKYIMKSVLLLHKGNQSVYDNQHVN